jgi:hypothetical protein
VPVELIWTLRRDVAPARAPGAPARTPHCRTLVRHRTRVPRRARDPRSEHCVPREVPLRHVEPSPSPASRAPRYPSIHCGSPPVRARRPMPLAVLQVKGRGTPSHEGAVIEEQ